MRHFRQVFHEVMDFTVVDAPFECDEAAPKELKRFITENNKSGKFRTWLKFPKQQPNDCVYGLEEVTSFLSDLLRQQGPFDGIIVFS